MSTHNLADSETNSSRNKITPYDEKTEHPYPHPNPSVNVTAGQTGLPWLTHDAEVEVDTSGQDRQSPPPKFRARPKVSARIRFPTRKRTMQKHIYSMQDGIDPTKVLCRRLSSWEISVKYLISLFKRIKKIESSFGKGYRKIDVKYTIPTKIQDQFKSSNGVQDAWTAFRQYARENSLIHEDFVDFIQNDITPALNVMLKDIRGMKQSLKSSKLLKTTQLWDCRKRADKLITQFNSNVYKTVKAQEKAKGSYFVPKKDPLLLKFVVTHTIKDLYRQENQLHKNCLQVQDQYRQFEQEKIIDAYSYLFRTFETYRNEHRLENLEGVAKVAAIFKSIETDAEWLSFFQHHQNELVRLTAEFKDEENIDFPYASHPLVQPLAHGVLQKYQSKKWVSAYYILSPVGMLYRYKSEENLFKAPFKPDLVMFVPKCTMLINPGNRLLQLKGKPLKGMHASKRTMSLSSTDSAQAIEYWIDALTPMVNQQETGTMDINPPAINRSSSPSLATASENGNLATTDHAARSISSQRQNDDSA
ncbi:hypothetical protein BD560DRAFT_445126 [Blakeslea trispora]|nr:hypothetical protein BD560DRAFT_445126 [Blakeslea trispora]